MHQAVYDNGDGTVAIGAWSTDEMGGSIEIRSTFVEYGFPTIDRGTNQPNVFYVPRSERIFPHALLVDLGCSCRDGGFAPTRDETLAGAWTAGSDRGRLDKRRP